MDDALTTRLVVENLGFFLISSAMLAAGLYIWRGAPDFTGSRRSGTRWFRIWFVLIWLLTILLPLGVLIGVGLIGGDTAVIWALAPYLVMIVAQVGWERVALDRFHSPVWVLVPCFYLPWRLFQVYRGDQVLGHDPASALADWTLTILFVMWVINIGIHYTGIIDALRWNDRGEGRKAETAEAGSGI